MPLAGYLLQQAAPASAVDYTNDAIATRQKQQAGDISIQSGQQDLATKRRALALSTLNGIQNAQDPAAQAQLYDKLKPMAQSIDPTLQLPDQYDPAMHQALLTSQIPIEKQRELTMEQQKIDQGNFEPVKDYLGNVTGFLNKKSGAVQKNTDLAQPATTVAGPDGNPLTGDDYLGTLSPTDAAMIKALSEGRMAMPSGFALKSPFWINKLQQLSQFDPAFDANRIKAGAAFNTGKQGDQVKSFSVAIEHLNTLGDLATALHNGDTKALNSLSNTFSTQFGQPAPTNFEAAKQIVGDEIIKAVVGGGGGQGDRDKAQQVISAANSPEQLAQVIQTYKTLIHGQLVGLQKQYETSTGRKDFESRLSPTAAQQLTPPQRMPIVTTQEQFDALPSGATYVESDGNKYKKP